MSAMIEVKDISKKYIKKTSSGSSYKTVREAITTLPSKILKPSPKDTAQIENNDNFWALKDINFTVNEGDVVGIIGRNGAGKSTLLKIISQITTPTSGEIVMHGRVGSLLEVGTGFHPELTGRENIFLNGAILGMSRAEILKKFDEIVDFAGVEDFIDVPIKRYSSGMRMRLAFAVAAHLDPEILIIDEVLAVGDAQFQKKCLGKMKDVSKSGRTILFVSHSMSAVQSLCTRAIRLEKGEVVYDGDTLEAIQYHLGIDSKEIMELENVKHRNGSQDARVNSIELSNNKKKGELYCTQPGNITFHIERKNKTKSIKNPILGMVIKSITGVPLAHLNTAITGLEFSISDTPLAIQLQIEEVPLMPGQYILDFTLNCMDGLLDQVLDQITFEVNEFDVYKTGYMPYTGVAQIAIKAKWNIL